MSSDWVSTSMPYLRPGGDGPGGAWREEARARGRRGGQRIVHAGEVAAPEVVAGLLGVAEGSPVVVRRRVMYADEEPVELTDAYFPLHIARGTSLADPAKIPGGAVALLAELGYVGHLVREDVTARLPTDEERALLRAARDEPVLQLARLTFDREERPVQADVMVMPAARRRLRYELRLD